MIDWKERKKKDQVVNRVYLINEYLRQMEAIDIPELKFPFYYSLDDNRHRIYLSYNRYVGFHLYEVESSGAGHYLDNLLDNLNADFDRLKKKISSRFKMNKQAVIDKLINGRNWQGSDIIGSTPGMVGEETEEIITEGLLKEWALELLEEWGKKDLLPEDAVVFCIHQGYSFYCFRESECAEGNPMIYSFVEGPDSKIEEVMTLELFIDDTKS